MRLRRWIRKLKWISYLLTIIFLYIYFRRTHSSIRKGTKRTAFTRQEETKNLNLWNKRANEVREAFRHAWKGYKEFSWGKDELKPVSKSGDEWFGLGLTIIDSLDTAYLMSEMEIFNEAHDWIDESLTYDHDGY